jgi:hypothetical protein
MEARAAAAAAHREYLLNELNLESKTPRSEFA